MAVLPVKEAQQHLVSAFLPDREWETIWDLSSNWARIFRLRHRKTQETIIAKIPVFSHLGRLGLDERKRVAEELNQTTVLFLAELNRLGVKTPQEYVCHVSKDGYLVHVMTDEGCNLLQDVEAGRARPADAFRKVIAAIDGVLQSDERRVGIDTRPENFTANGVYMDLFPPLVRVESTWHVHFPPPSSDIVPLEVERKFTPFGILRRLFFEILWTNPEWEADFFDALDVLPTGLRTALEEQFRALPANQVITLSTEERREMIAGLGLYDVDSRRELAVRLIPSTHPCRKELLEKVFQWTSLVAAPDEAALRERGRYFSDLITPFI